MKKFSRLRNLVLFPILALLILGALALSLNKAGRSDAPATLPAAAYDEAPDARAEAAKANALRIAEQRRSAEAAATKERRATLVGIWAPLPGGCEQGYGIAFAPDGRFGDGDETSGIEGHWEIDGDTLIRTHRVTYDIGDDLADEPAITKSSASDRLAIERLSATRLTLRLGGKRQRYVKCGRARHLFLDGRTFGS